MGYTSSRTSQLHENGPQIKEQTHKQTLPHDRLYELWLLCICDFNGVVNYNGIKRQVEHIYHRLWEKEKHIHFKQQVILIRFWDKLYKYRTIHTSLLNWRSAQSTSLDSAVMKVGRDTNPFISPKPETRDMDFIQEREDRRQLLTIN